MKAQSVPPLLRVIAVQLTAWTAVTLLAPEMPTQPEARLLLQGVIASLLGRLLGLPYWWAPINLLLPLLLLLPLSGLNP